jgi:hypothetical protein
MAGRCALNAGIVVQVHGREPELWSIGRMTDRLSAGTGSIPVSSAIGLREIRPAARTLASRSSDEGSSPSSPAILYGKSEHGLAAGASAFQADDASSTLAARSIRVLEQSLCWSSTVAVQRACTSFTGVRFTRPAPSFNAGFQWRDWPNGLGAGLWLQSREFDSLISPQMGGSYKGIIRGLQPRDASSTLAPSTNFGSGTPTAECSSEKPVDTVQFRAEPPGVSDVS